MNAMSGNWRHRALRLVIFGCLQFVILTLIAMLAYSGGTARDPAAPRYQFFGNFFSDLGRTVAHNGQTNTLSAVLFFIALTGAGLGLILFFLAQPGVCRHWRPAYALSLLGSLAGLISGLSFIGVAFTPADVAGRAHMLFVYYAFVPFLIAVVLYSVVVLLVPDYPRIYAAVFAAFGLILGGYVWLIFNGPEADTSRGLLIQVTGQKIVAYAAILTALIQAHGARRLLAERRSLDRAAAAPPAELASQAK